MLKLLILCVAFSSAFAAEPPACCRKEMGAAVPLPDKSLYQVSSIWTNDAKAGMEFGSMRGRPVVLTMFFARCEFACPLLVNDMKRIEAGLPEGLRTNVTFALVTFDSARDNPAALRAFRQTHRLPENWILLTGSPEDTQELAALLGVKFKKDGRGQFAHSNLVTLLDSNGETIRQQSGLNQPGTEIVSALTTLLTGR